MEAFTADSVLVFKTDVTKAKQVQRISELLDSNNQVMEWNVDVDDCDHVLRIVSNGIQISEIIKMMSDAGFQCEELIG